MFKFIVTSKPAETETGGDKPKTAQEIALTNAEKSASEVNASRTGKGTRVRVGQTRGRNPQVISYEAFDESKPETLPTTLTEFMSITGIDKMPGNSGEQKIVSLLIDGFNSDSYTTASDPVAEFVEATWPEEVQKAFRTVVRQYAANANVSIEDAVALIKPGIVASQAKK